MKDLPEALLKYDTALLLAMLQAFAPGAPAAVFEKLAASKKKWQFALGDWCQMNLHARRLLAHLPTPKDHDELLPLLHALRASDVGTLEHLFAALSALRNREHGHGFTSPNAEPLLNECEQIWSRVRPQLRYVNRFPLIYIESRSVLRDQLQLKVRMLVHDNAEFALNSMHVNRGSASERLNDREVYVLVSEPAGYLSLYPWIVYAPRSGKGVPTVWLLDAVKKTQVVYKSPFAPGETHASPATLNDTRFLMKI